MSDNKNQETGKVSVIIPTYNHGRYVTEAVQSAISQTYGNTEVIVIDDGSTDDTRHQLEVFGNRITYCYQENAGLSAARNAGIRKSSGEWIAFLDADDKWHAQKTEIQLRSAEKVGNLDFIGSPYFDEMPELLPDDPDIELLEVRDFFVRTPITGSSTMVRRHCFEAAGLFDTKLTSAEDRDMWLRLVAAFRGAEVRSPCWYYRQMAGQMSRNAGRMYRNLQIVVKKFFRDHARYGGLRSQADAFLFMDAALAHLDQGERALAAWFAVRSILSRPVGWLGNKSRWRLLGRILFDAGAFRAIRGVLRSVGIRSGES